MTYFVTPLSLIEPEPLYFKKAGFPLVEGRVLELSLSVLTTLLEIFRSEVKATLSATAVLSVKYGALNSIVKLYPTASF